MYLYQHYSCAIPWPRSIPTTVKRAFTSYQYWVARCLDPQHYGQAPDCYATMQQPSRHAQQQAGASADQSLERAPSELYYLDKLAARLEGLSDRELSALIARLNAKNGPSWAAASRTMSDVDLDAFMTTLEAAIRRPGWARRLMIALRAHTPEALPEREQR